MKAIYKRELKAYFDSMTGWLFVAFLVLFTGIYFLTYNLNGGYPYFSYALSGLTTIMMVAVPVLTMRSMAEERRLKTDQLLLTSPLTVTGMVLGKYLSMVTVFAVPVLISCLCPLIIYFNGTAYLAADYAAILAYFLMGCLFIAMGMLISAMTESQVIAAVGTFGALLILLLWPALLELIPVTASGSAAGFALLWSLLLLVYYKMTSHGKSTAAFEAGGLAVMAAIYLLAPSTLEHALTDVLSYFSVTEIFNTFVYNHLFDLGGLLGYLSAIVFFIFLTVQTVEKRRWS